MSLKDDLLKNRSEVDNKKTKVSKPKSKTTKQHVSYGSSNLGTLMIQRKLDSLFHVMRQEHNLGEKRVGLHASSIIKPDNEFCLREQLLSLFYEQSQGNDLPVSLLKIFACGNTIHEKWQNMFERGSVDGSGFVCVANEMRSFSKRYDLLFTPDSIVKIFNKTYVCEIKSMNTFSFKNATSHPSGQKQCLLYMHLLGIKNGFVLAEDKNTGDVKIFPVEYDYTKVLPYIDRLNEIQECKKAFLKYKEMPPRKCRSKETNLAKRCNMCDICFGSASHRKEKRLKLVSD